MIDATRLRGAQNAQEWERRYRRMAFAPPPELTVSEWADRYRVLSRGTSAEPGRWRTARTPYLREIMDALGDPSVEHVVFMKSGRVGATAWLYAERSERSLGGEGRATLTLKCLHNPRLHRQIRAGRQRGGRVHTANAAFQIRRTVSPKETD